MSRSTRRNKPIAKADAKPDQLTQWRRAKALELAIRAAPYIFARGDTISGHHLQVQAEEIEKWLMKPETPASK